MPYRVLIVDDQRMARQLFESVIEGAEWYELAGSLESAEEAAKTFCLRSVAIAARL